MKQWIPEVIKGGITLLVEGVKAIKARRAGKRRTATQILEEHGDLRSTAARERAREALEREE
jgi:hypothetical protein